MLIRKILALGVFALSLLIAAENSSSASERILRMDVLASVRMDSSVTISEVIQVQAEGREIRRGIIRVIPVEYETDGRIVRTGFNLLWAELNGKPVAYRVSRDGANIEIRLGDADSFLPVGVHTYRLRYQMTNQLLFFQNHDELYWNVTGNEWIFPIDKASFRVELPGGARFNDFSAYTGAYRSKGKDFVLDRDGTFRTTRSLRPGEGFTVAVGWSKGLVVPPPESFIQKHGVSVLLISFIAMLLWYIYAWWRWGRDPSQGVVIPLFAPPENMEPSVTRMIAKGSYDKESLAADILYLAVKGFLTIREKSGLILEKKASPPDISLLSGNLKLLMVRLFSEGDKIDISSQSDAVSKCLYELIEGGRSALNLALEPYYHRNFAQLFGGIVFFLPGLIAIWNDGDTNISMQTWTLFGVSTMVLFIVFAFLMPAYTPLGWNFLNKIRGFVLYLSVAEKYRLEALYPAVQGQVPEQTPEIFEKFLPYAVALDTANTWGDSFANLLRSSPPPEWYTGGDMLALDRMARVSMMHSIGQGRAAWEKKISPPAKSSGSGLGGGGFSGGGRGGGGGRGW